MKLNKKLKLTAAALIAGLSQSAMATAAASNELHTFHTIVEGFARGALGVTLSITMLLVGAALGAVKNSPMPALSGIVGAAFLHWLPEVLTSFVSPTSFDINISTMPIFLFACKALAIALVCVVFPYMWSKSTPSKTGDSNIVHKPEEPEPKIEEFSVVDETFGKTHIFYDLAQKRINALDITDDMKHEMIKKLDMLASNEVLFSKEELIEQKNKVMLIIHNNELAQKQALKKSLTF